jgi:aerobic-type carbon monoxide dehydrogenase small subunit (CoxS/CutS family)
MQLLARHDADVNIMSGGRRLTPMLAFRLALLVEEANEECICEVPSTNSCRCNGYAPIIEAVREPRVACRTPAALK